MLFVLEQAARCDLSNFFSKLCRRCSDTVQGTSCGTLGEKDVRDDEMGEDTQEEDSTHDEYDQDSSISFNDDEDSTASQEDDLEDWTEDIKRSTKEADEKMLAYNVTNLVTTQTELKWRQALRIACHSPDRWARKGFSYRQRLKGEQGDQPIDGKTT